MVEGRLDVGIGCYLSGRFEGIPQLGVDLVVVSPLEVLQPGVNGDFRKLDAEGDDNGLDQLAIGVSHLALDVAVGEGLEEGEEGEEGPLG